MGSTCEVVRVMGEGQFQLVVVRHGQTEANNMRILQGHLDGDLSEVGREQARLVGERLKYRHFDLGIVSDLRRAVATAGAIVDQSCSLQDVVKRETARERNFGDFEGRPHNDLRVVEETIPDSEKSTWGPPNGETGVQFRKRIETFLQDLCSEIQKLSQDILAPDWAGVPTLECPPTLSTQLQVEWSEWS